MHQMPRGSLSAAILIAIIFVSKPTRAQYTADFQTNIISGVTSNWTGDYLIGSNTFADVLLIQDGGVLTNWFGYLGYEVSSSNNSALVSGQGSVWSNGFLSGIARFYVGYRGAGNSLVISNEGSVICASACWESSSGYVGYYSSSSNNVVLVTSTGSVWSSSCVHYIGLNGSGNTLVVNNGGQMIDLTGIVGGYSGNNNVVITAPGSVWSNSGSAIIGQFGVGNSLVISNGGKVVNKVGHIGTSSTNNTVLVSGPGSVWSNTTLTVGYYDSCSNSLVISGGGRVFNASGFVCQGKSGSAAIIFLDTRRQSRYAF